MPATVVIGYGHQDCADDEAGLLVARGLLVNAPAGADVFALSGDAITLVEAWECCETTILVNAIDTGRRAGTIYRLEGEEAVNAARAPLSAAHAVAVREAIQLGEIQGRMPKRFIYYGIEAHVFTAGAPMTAAVAEAVAEVISRVSEECAALGQGRAEGAGIG